MPRSNESRRKYLKQRGSAWYLNYPIPSDLRHLYQTAKGNLQTHIVQSLGTSDLLEADYRKKKLIADLERQFRKDRRTAAGVLPSQYEEARELREELEKIKANGSENDIEGWHYAATERAERIAGDPDKQTPASIERSDNFWRIANGVLTLNDLFVEWTGKEGIKGRTLQKYRTAFKEFMNYKKLSDGLPDEMNRSAAVDYVDWLNREGRSQRTKSIVPLSYNSKKDRVAALRAFWSGMERRGAVKGSNPWTRLPITERPTSESSRWSDLSNVGRPKKRQPFTTEDLLSILNAPEPSSTAAMKHSKRQMLEVFAIALLTGARPEEICSRRIGDLKKKAEGYWLSIRDSKNAASDRDIPIVHPIAVELIDRLMGARSEKKEMLFPYLSPSKTDGTYSRNIGKALQRFFAKIPSLDKTHVPYASRHTFQSLMGNLENVNDALLDRYVGHANKSMMDRHYRTFSPESLVSFAKKISYDPVVEKRLREELGLD